MADYVDKGLKRAGITISKPMLAAVCIISGIIVILLPSLLVWIVGLYLVTQGALFLADYFQQEIPRTTATMTKGVHCYSCGARNTEEAVYCKSCGEKLAEAEQIVTAQPQEVVQ